MENTIAQVWSQYTGISLLQRTVATAAENFNISKERFDKAQLTNELGDQIQRTSWPRKWI